MTNDPLPLVPQEIKAIPSWVLWRLESRQDNPSGKPTKVPYSAKTGRLASSTNPATWTTYEEAAGALSAQRIQATGLGWVFTLEAGIVGVDLDGVRDPQTGTVESKAVDILSGLDSYTEYSPSGKGYHVLVRATLPPEGNRKGFLEMYSKQRYFTMSGLHVAGTRFTVEARQEELEAIQALWISREEEKPPVVAPRPRPAAAAMSDQDIIRRAAASKFGAEFQQLYSGDWKSLGKYPSQSEADQSFANKLAFWFGCDVSRMDSVFRSSGLYRPKWDRESYGRRTLERAVRSCRDTYSPQRAI